MAFMTASDHSVLIATAAEHRPSISSPRCAYHPFQSTTPQSLASLHSQMITDRYVHHGIRRTKRSSNASKRLIDLKHQSSCNITVRTGESDQVSRDSLRCFGTSHRRGITLAGILWVHHQSTICNTVCPCSEMKHPEARHGCFPIGSISLAGCFCVVATVRPLSGRLNRCRVCDHHPLTNCHLRSQLEV